jgi:ketosteroid isomerase-like protein
MSQQNIDLVRQGYERLNEALRTGDLAQLAVHVEEICDRDIVLRPSGLLPESAEMHGHAGMVQFAQIQADAFEALQVEPQEFIDAEDSVVVPVRFGGRARHTGLEVDFSIVHVWTIRDTKLLRLDMYQTAAEALEAAGLPERD